MEYMLLIYAEEDALPEMAGDLVEEYRAYNAALADAGAFVGASRLQPVRTASTQRRRGGELETTDGPFADTKEQLAGYYLIRCETRAEALEWAARMPACRVGSIEVRPVM